MRLAIPPLALLFLLALLPGVAAQDGTRAEIYGITFVTLPATDLDAIEQNLGYRVGVGVLRVQPGTPGAASGLKTNDLIFLVGQTPVDTAEKAVAALKAAQGEVELPGMQFANDDYTAKTFKLKMTGAATGTIGQAPLNDNAPVPPQTSTPLAAYFDMMDFIRSQAWGRKVVTPAAERQRVALQLQTVELDRQSAALLLQIPQAWSAVQNKWKGWNDTQKSKQKAEWYAQLLQPGGLYPPPASPQQFTAPQGLGVAFQYPGDWTGGWTEGDGTPLLFLGPGAGQAQWEQVLDTPNSPPGALFTLATVTADMKNMTYLQGAHYLAKLLIPQGLQSLKVIQELPIGDTGAVITLTGKFPGQSEDKFYWIGVVKFGDSQVFAGRLGGPVKQAETLIPAFSYMLQTLQLTPPQAAGGVRGAWETAWSRVDVAITKNIWAPSGN